MTATNRGHRLRALRALTETHLGRTVTLPGDPGLTGKLAGLIPLGDHYQAVLICGGARIFTDAMPGDTFVEVWQKGETP